MWADVLRTIRNDNVLPSDLIRIHIAHRELPKGDIIIPLQTMASITVDSIMNRIDTVLQSYATLRADDQLEISVGIIRFPRGEGTFEMINLELDLCKKKSVTMIDNTDGKCLARSLVVCRAYTRLQEKQISRKNFKMIACPIHDGREHRDQLAQADELIASLGISV